MRSRSSFFFLAAAALRFCGESPSPPSPPSASPSFVASAAAPPLPALSSAGSSPVGCPAAADAVAAGAADDDDATTVPFTAAAVFARPAPVADEAVCVATAPTTCAGLAAAAAKPAAAAGWSVLSPAPWPVSPSVSIGAGSAMGCAPAAHRQTCTRQIQNLPRAQTNSLSLHLSPHLVSFRGGCGAADIALQRIALCGA